MRRYWKLFGMSLFAAGTVACSTIEGVGKDVEEVGEEIQETSENNR
ncbi:entericidin A/B family lipoprotein [Parvularcula marina]